MFCNNCGSKNGDDELFCSVCGSKLEKSAADTETTVLNENQEFTQSTQNTSNNTQNQTQEQSFTQANYETASTVSSNPTPPKKGFGAGKIIGIGVGAVAVVAVATVGTLAATGRLGNFLHKNFTSPESYFKYVAENTSDDNLKSFTESYDTALESLDSSSELNGYCNVKLEAGEALKPMMGLLDSSLSNLENAAISINSTVDDSVQNMELKAHVNDTEIATIKASIDMENETGYIQIPELSDTYIDISDGFSEISSEMGGSSSEYTEAVEMVKEVLPDSKTMTNMVSTYLDIVYDNIDDVKKSSKTIKAEGVSQKCTELTATLDGKYCYNTVSDLLKQLSDDKDIKEIIENIDEDAYEEFSDEIDYAIENIDDLEDSFEDMDAEAKIALYVDAKGDVAGTEITITNNDDEIVVSSIMPQKGSKFGYEMKVAVDDSDIVSLTGKGTIKKDVMNGNFSLSLGDEIADEIDDYVSDTEDIASLEIKDFNIKDSKAGKLNGTLILSTDKISEIEGYELTASFETTDTESSIALSVSSSGSDWGTITLTAGEGDKVDTIDPSEGDVISISDEDDLESYIEDIDIEAFVENVIDASGIDIDSEDLMEMIEDSLGSVSSYDDYDYDYDYDDDYSYDDESDYYDYDWD